MDYFDMQTGCPAEGRLLQRQCRVVRRKPCCWRSTSEWHPSAHLQDVFWPVFLTSLTF